MKFRQNTIALVAAACLLLGVNASEAAVTLTFSQLNANTVIAVWSGTYLVPETSIRNGSSVSQVVANTNAFFGRDGDWRDSSGGTVDVSGMPSLTGTYVGDNFGYTFSVVIFPRVTGTISPSGTFTFSGTLAGLGIPNYNNFLAYTGANNVGNSSQIFFTTIPEPSGVILLGLGAVGFVTRRQRKHTV